MKLAVHDRCYGCGACAAACPHSAIMMKPDQEGFIYPDIDAGKCVDCHLCEKACPVGTEKALNNGYPRAYALKHKDKDVLFASSSGGAFTAFSDVTLRENGHVYGAVFDSDYSVKHACAATSDVRNRMRGSKYIQSRVDVGIYRQIAADVKAGIPVLFSGTPCQCAAVRQYLQSRKMNADHCLYVDLICHGASSPLIWRKLVERIENKYGNIKSLQLRAKDQGYAKYLVKVITEQGDVTARVEKEEPFYKLYSSLCITRPSCYSCPYSSLKRSGDLTIGDFHELKQQNSPFYSDLGVSTVLVNTDRGQRIFGQVVQEAEIQQVTLKEAWHQNLECPTKRPGNREKLWRIFEQRGIDGVIQKYGSLSLPRRIIFNIIVPLCKKTGLYNFAIKVYMKR